MTDTDLHDLPTWPAEVVRVGCWPEDAPWVRLTFLDLDEQELAYTLMLPDRARAIARDIEKAADNMEAWCEEDASG